MNLKILRQGRKVLHSLKTGEEAADVHKLNIGWGARIDSGVLSALMLSKILMNINYPW